MTAPAVKALAVDELGDTVYPENEVTISVPATVAYAVFDYSGLPPGDARLKVTVEVIDTPTPRKSKNLKLLPFSSQTLQMKMANQIG